METTEKEATVPDTKTAAPQAAMCTCPTCREALRYRVPRYKLPTALGVIGDILLAGATLVVLLLALAATVSLAAGFVEAAAQGMPQMRQAAFTMQFTSALTAGVFAALLILYPKFHMFIRGLFVKALTVEVDPVGGATTAPVPQSASGNNEEVEA